MWTDYTASVAGFFCGDGCVQFRKSSTAKIGQALTNIGNLLDLQKKYGGSIVKSKDATDAADAQYTWSLNGEEARNFMYEIRPHCLKSSKADQIDILLNHEWKHLRYVDDDERHRLEEERRIMKTKIRKLKVEDDDADVAAETMSDAFIGGFFTAEGSIVVTSHTSFNVNFSQKNPAILRAIQAHFGGCGYLSENGLRFGNSHEMATNVLRRIRPYVGPIKLKQIDAALKLDLSNKDEVIEILKTTKGAQGKARKQNAHGGVYEIKLKGVLTGYVAKLRDHAQTFTSTKLSLEEKYKLALEQLENFTKLPWDAVASPKNSKYERKELGPRVPTRYELVKQIVCFPANVIKVGRGSVVERIAGPPFLFTEGAKEIEAYFKGSDTPVAHEKVAACLKGKRKHTFSMLFKLYSEYLDE
jgi:hypothetical protein